MAQVSPLLAHQVAPYPGSRRIAIDHTELRRLNQLLGAALIDEGVHRQLIEERDPTLLTRFELRDETQVWLRGLTIASLDELAYHILSAHQQTGERV